MSPQTAKELIASVYSTIAEDLHHTFDDWPQHTVARAWEIQQHFGHSVGLVNNRATAYRYFYCRDCRVTLVLNVGLQGRKRDTGWVPLELGPGWKVHTITNKLDRDTRD